MKCFSLENYWGSWTLATPQPPPLWDSNKSMLHLVIFVSTFFIMLLFYCYYFSENTENPSIGRKEVANASEILNKYLRKKCYDKRTRPNVTGI